MLSIVARMVLSYYKVDIFSSIATSKACNSYSENLFILSPFSPRGEGISPSPQLFLLRAHWAASLTRLSKASSISRDEVTPGKLTCSMVICYSKVPSAAGASMLPKREPSSAIEAAPAESS